MSLFIFNSLVLITFFSISCASPLIQALIQRPINETAHSPQPPHTSYDYDQIKHVTDRQVTANFDFDVLGIAESIQNGIQTANNREGFVKDLMYTTFYTAGSKYNVMIFNLNQDHSNQLQGIMSYGSVTHDGVTYGIWVFQFGSFENKGDHGYENWAFMGWFDRDGSKVDFRYQAN